MTMDARFIAVCAFRDWLSNRGDSAFLSEARDFYARHPVQADKLKGKLKKVLLGYPSLFRIEFTLGKDKVWRIAHPKPSAGHQNASSAQQEQENYSETNAIGDFKTWLSAQGRPQSAGCLGMFYQHHPRAAVYIRGKAKTVLSKYPNIFVISELTPNSITISLVQARRSHQEEPSVSNGNSHVTNRRSNGIPNARNEQNRPVNRESRATGRPKSTGVSNVPLLAQRKALEKNRGGIVILPEPATVSATGLIPFVPIQFTIVFQDASLPVSSSITLNQIELCDPRTRPQRVQMQLLNFQYAIKLLNPSQLIVKVDWMPECPTGPVKLHVVQVRFNFVKDGDANGAFSISRFIMIDAGGANIVPPTVVNRARPTKQYFPHNRAEIYRFNQDNVEFPNPERLARSASLFVNLYHVHLLRTPDVSYLAREFNVSLANYSAWFSILLHLNFAVEVDELEKYDLRNQQPMRKPEHPNLLFFLVPGLGEKRPSVLQGDRTLLESESIGTTYGGLVKVVGQQDVGILLNETSSTNVLRNKRDINVRFLANKFTFRMTFTALGTARPSLERLFDDFSGGVIPSQFTAEVMQNPFDRPRDGLWTRISNHPFMLNTKQCCAVHAIVTLMPPSQRQAPFLVFGPPGTGKTTTLVAAVAALLLLRPSVRIIVAAPSNAACDVFCKKLEILLGKARATFVIERLLSSALGNDVDPERAERASVIIATCVTAGKLSATSKPFTHVFIDEAAQCTEPEALIPLFLGACHSPPRGEHVQFILGGDHRQLGPVVMSEDAVRLGRLDMSLFERLMKFHVYRTLHPSYAVQLEDNYRSHRDLLHVPSHLFYSGRLKAMENNESLCTLTFLPSQGVPLIVHHIAGMEDRENTSPSWFNLAECVTVIKYIRLLFENGVPLTDISVIAPYSGQVRKIRMMLSDLKLQECRVDSVEKFQGDESRVVIVSTCRSSSINDDYDAKYHVGFLKNERRMNVAITRAKELLIVVGNVKVLDTDFHWKELMKFAREKRVLVGEEANEDDDSD